MIVVLSNNKYMYKTVLPEKIAGRYWLKDEINGKVRNLVCVEASDNRWIAKSNRYARFYGYDNESIKEVELINGMAYMLRTDDDEKTLLFADTYTSSGSEFVRLQVPANMDISIGREENNIIRYDNKFVSGFHAVIRRNNDVWTIQDNGSTNGTYVNNVRIGLATLVPGDIIYIMGLRIIIGSDFISINNPNKQVEYDYTVLKSICISECEVDTTDEDEDEDGEVFFYRSPRLTSRIEMLKLKVSPPIAPQDTEKTPMAMMIGPSLTMGMGSAGTAAFSVINAIGRNSSLISVAPTLIMSMAMMSGMILWLVITRNYEKKQKIKLENKRQSKYKEYLTQIRDTITKAIREQSDILRNNNVSLSECEDTIMLAKRNLWERSIGQDDFLSLRIGTGDINLDSDIDFPGRGFTIEEDNLWDDLQALSKSPRVLKDVPITYSLIENWVSGVVGECQENVYDFIRSLVIRIASDYSYDEVKVMVIADEEDESNWNYIKWIPHIWDNSGNVRFFASNENDANELFSLIDKLIEAYENEDDKKELSQYYIIFNASKKLTKKSETIKKLYENGGEYGFSVINITDELRNLPKECSQIIEIAGDNSKVYDKRDISGQCQMFKVDSKLIHSADNLTRRLSRIKLDLSSSSEELPSMLTFLEMYQISKIEHLNIRTRWKNNNPTLTLKAPVGVDSLGNLFYLDLHEKFQGPHGLVAGMTGSGKSEFIITYILSMAVNYHPDEVAFILIDYKGGGLAGAFENKDKGIKLPHLAGTITNLDGAAINRSLVSIQSELRKRQAIFNEARQISNEGTMDIYKYQKLYREGIVSEPVPHLFIISDEFAELKTQQPEFMEQLISTARIGRSLGVHLILATQKPSGVVNDQIWSNSRFRVCLKVQEKSDSMDMIKRPDAAELSATGRFYLQVGYNEFFDMGQSAWCGAPYVPSDNIVKKDEEDIQIIDNVGRIVKDVKPAATEDAKNKKHIKQIVGIVNYLSEIADEDHISVRKLWLDEIPAYITVSGLAEKYSYVHEDRSLEVIIGEYDDPFNQEQNILSLNISEAGNTIIYGSAGSGKELFLNTFICGLLENYSPDQVNLFIVDFGSEALQMYAKAPQVGNVILSTDEEQLTRLMRILKEQINERKKMLAEYGGNPELYEKSTGNTISSIITIIDNYAAVNELYEDVIEDIAYITREGSKYRIYFVVTASSVNEVKYKVLQNFGRQYVLQMNDKSDYTSVLGSVKGVYPSKIYGRGLFMTDRAYEFQTAHVCRDEEMQAYISGLIDELNRDYRDAEVIKVPVVPENLIPDDITAMGTIDKIQVGVDLEFVKPVYFNYRASSVSIISGISMEEIIAVAMAQYELISRLDDCEVSILDKDTDEETIVQIFRMMVERNNSYKDDSTLTFRQKFYFIMQWQSVLNKLSEDGQDKLKVLIEHSEHEYNANFILCDTIDAIKIYSPESWFANKANKNNYIWVGNEINDQVTLRHSLTYRDTQNLRSDCTLVINKDSYTAIKPITQSVKEDGEE